MKLYDQIMMCLGNLFRRKLRTLLTVSGVVIGTCAIVVMISLGVGMQKSQDEMLANMGDLTMITVNNYGNRNNLASGGKEVVLDDAALKQIEAMEHVDVVTPFMNPGVYNAFTIYGGNSNRYQLDLWEIVGVYPEALEKMGYKIKEGDFLPDITKVKSDTVTILVGQNVPYDFRDTKKKRNNMISYWTPDGSEPPKPFVNMLKDKMVFRINSTKEEGGKTLDLKVRVSGILMEDTKDYTTSYGVYMSVDQMRMLVEKYNKLNNIKSNSSQKDKGYQQVKVKTTDMKYVEEIEEAIQEMGFSTYSMETVRKPLEEKARQQQLTLGGLGAISLLVAALGITNTMIMSIYERTREIGVMKVLGCMVNNIRSVFLMEAGVIGFMGGVIGVGISYGISYLINFLGSGIVGGASGGISYGGGGMYFGGDMSSGMGQTSIIPPWLVVAALVFSTMIGLVSGFTPANRAVKISALEAIKNE